jgi:hypothetical protein
VTQPSLTEAQGQAHAPRDRYQLCDEACFVAALPFSWLTSRAPGARVQHAVTTRICRQRGGGSDYMLGAATGLEFADV